ncbi:hypothetical protein RJ641_020556 [Dillenia turbinata]|uniref:Protein kinase domain-containing protein n=1 Tax=Dillenia turbinata TaxID=194707 RepID=A0AAN8UMB5_9MAGN
MAIDFSPDIMSPRYEPKSPSNWYLRDRSGGCTRKRMSPCVGTERENEKKKKRSFIAKNKRVVIPISSAAVVFTLVVTVISLRTIKRRNLEGEAKQNLQGLLHGVTNSTSRLSKDLLVVNGQKVGSPCPNLALYDFSTVVAATNNFALENMLGRGGFGSAYKVKSDKISVGDIKIPKHPLGNDDIQISLLCGSANIWRRNCHKKTVEWVSTRCGRIQNEVMLITQLQHKNLVKLLGCCTQQEKRSWFMSICLIKA